MEKKPGNKFITGEVLIDLLQQLNIHFNVFLVKLAANGLDSNLLKYIFPCFKD